jgi:cephalosporin hydroxylase
VDLEAPSLSDEKVTFIDGDCREVDAIMPLEVLKNLPHPWIVIEDAHQNTEGILCHFSKMFRSGDYIVVEDSRGKRKDLETFSRQCGEFFRVDTDYTDFYGRNATSCADSIFRWS